MDPMLALSWEAYQKSICNGLSLLQQRGEFVDMTIAADGHRVKVHQMVMSLVSPFIKELITSAECSHPIIFLNKVSNATLQSILEYAYTGEVMVARESLASFLETCKELHIKGLEGDNIKIKGDDGDLLHLIGARGGDDPVTLDADWKVPAQTAVRRAMNVEVMDESTNDDYKDDNYQMDDHALDDVEESAEIARKVEPDRTLTAKQETAPLVQYSLSCQGHVQLILNRYIYCMRHMRKNNERMWRCVDYKPSGCNATTVTKGDKVVFRGRMHSHPFHDKQILKRAHNNNIYTTFKTVEQLSKFSLNLPERRKLSKTSSKKNESVDTVND